MTSHKYGIMIIIVFFMGFLVFVANAIELQYLSNIDETFVMPENFIDQAFSILGTFGRLITFRVLGLPNFVNAVLTFSFYTPVVFFIIMLVVNWIRGVE